MAWIERAICVSAFDTVRITSDTTCRKITPQTVKLDLCMTHNMYVMHIHTMYICVHNVVLLVSFCL